MKELNLGPLLLELDHLPDAHKILKHMDQILDQDYYVDYDGRIWDSGDVLDHLCRMTACIIMRYFSMPINESDIATQTIRALSDFVYERILDECNDGGPNKEKPSKPLIIDFYEIFKKVKDIIIIYTYDSVIVEYKKEE